MAQAPKKPQKSGGGGGLVGMIVVTLLAAAGGGGFGYFLYQNFTQSHAGKAEPAHTIGPDPAGGEKTGEPPLVKVIPLNPLVVNLADPADAWLRIEATVVIEGMKDGADQLALKVSEDIVAYLKTASLSQFEGPSGFQSLREDLIDRAKIRDGVHVKDLVIHGIVLE